MAKLEPASPILRRLILAGIRATGPGFAHLEGLASLQELDLTTTSVTDEAVRHIAKLTSLERLALSNSDITDDGIAQLVGSAEANWFRSTCAPSISAIAEWPRSPRWQVCVS